jgi:5-methylcytosine-specific restriction protein B
MNTEIDTISKFVKEKAEEFGGAVELDFIERNNTKDDAFEKGLAYFGIISPEEEHSGPYHDFSIVIFPSKVESNPWIVALVVGSLGFKNDYDLATFPGLRRSFSKLIDNENGFIKTDFSDIESGLPKSFYTIEKITHLKRAIDNNKGYGKVLSACQIIDVPLSDVSKNIIQAFLAIYAKIRGWDSKNKFKNSISNALAPFTDSQHANDEEEIFKLINERKYLIIQGPPGTGKTRLAKKVAAKLNAKIFFTQFHAETSYSDFIYGIRPNTTSANLVYIESLGDFTKALKHAIEKNEKTVLIIDEINRANLSNVLGPIFYLFEHKQEKSDVLIEIAPNLRLEKLPENFLVIATMNTADRSLAVVDFALRRRFAWYSLKPQPISSTQFFEEDFNRIQEIFDWYANSSELSLQPGQGYFLASSTEEMANRVRYELLPLIKEYLLEGLLRNAKEEFNSYFLSRIKLSLFE